jgi:signal transduction histidine kinase
MAVQLGRRRLALPSIAAIERCANRPLNLLTVGELLERSQCPHAPERVIQSARWMHEEIPLRIAHRLKDFHRLPCVAMSSEPFAQAHGLYLDAYEALTACPDIESLDHVHAFAATLRRELEAHRQVVPLMERAIGELKDFPDCRQELESFWDKLFVTRIGNRVLVEHFLAWLDGHASDGIVTECELAPLVQAVGRQLTELARKSYGFAPRVNVTVSTTGMKVPVIPDHVRYITQEVLKNAIRATCDNHGPAAPPVEVSIHQGTFDVMIKVADRGGGLSREVERRVWDYGFTTAGADAPRDGFRKALAGYGVGLPLCRLYARYFGGDINLHHMFGHGTEVLINLNRLGTSSELDVSSDSESERRERRERPRRKRMSSYA